MAVQAKQGFLGNSSTLINPEQDIEILLISIAEFDALTSARDCIKYHIDDCKKDKVCPEYIAHFEKQFDTIISLIERSRLDIDEDA